MSLNSIATIQTIVVLKMHHSGPLVQKIPPRLKAFMFNYLSKYLCADDVIASFAKHEASIERYDLDIVTTQIPVINTDIASCLCLVDEKGDNYTTLKQLRKESVQEKNCPKQRGCTNDSVIRELHQLSEYRRRKERQNSISEEWKLLAIILDRLFFVIYLIFTSCATLGILILMPVGGEWFNTKLF